jgi:outer membrane receptor protein involved in Fe transport
LPALDQLDLSIALERDRWTARLYATNVTDERGIVSSNFFGASINRPRTVGVSFDANFR